MKLSISFRHSTYSITVENPSEPAGSNFAFGILFPFNMKSFFLKSIQNRSNRGCSYHESIYKILILKRPQCRNTHSFHKDNRCIPDIYCKIYNFPLLCLLFNYFGSKFQEWTKVFCGKQVEMPCKLVFPRTFQFLPKFRLR